ncbi:alkylation response protein AidB-like acyl-CoA dehydrogenase [Natronobacillus azotifigens]|uniref:Acyl-CoA/acyl-ACP dehydrogenase n=1 Tax=Natronobacillus azotifigens TaxID=472978 RepID=A0A9J6RC61_9BACI|nr:acyl-CoA dehydrogenase family protein [Natronobacillus azotifigens]MCZ0703280.1 acyl-CoA/acyl-ACP dehydrogenase [Natronobacillus azotifigens]
MDLFQMYVNNEKQKALVEKTAKLAEKVQKRVGMAEETASLPRENIEDLRKEKYFSLTLAESYGGKALSLYDFLLVQERLAAGDGATALSVGWHLGIIKELSEDHLWNHDVFDWFAKQVASDQVLVNRIASEAATGSPTRGGIPETKAVRDGDDYLLTGRKTFATMASVLDYYIISAYIEDKETVGSFLVSSNSPGVRVEKTWDTLGMRGTGSDDVIFDEVRVDQNLLVELSTGQTARKSAKGWLLHIPACYLGIAIAARNDAITFAKNFQPNSLHTPIAEVAHIQQKIGEMDLKLMQARSFMYQVATKWDEEPEKREQLGAELAAVKTIATNTANEVVDLAMRIVGGRGLSKEYRFEQYYRDVRAGLHNPPMDDMVIQLLAKRALAED